MVAKICLALLCVVSLISVATAISEPGKIDYKICGKQIYSAYNCKTCCEDKGLTYENTPESTCGCSYEIGQTVVRGGKVNEDICGQHRYIGECEQCCRNNDLKPLTASFGICHCIDEIDALDSQICRKPYVPHQYEACNRCCDEKHMEYQAHKSGCLCKVAKVDKTNYLVLNKDICSKFGGWGCEDCCQRNGLNYHSTKQGCYCEGKKSTKITQINPYYDNICDGGEEFSMESCKYCCGASNLKFAEFEKGKCTCKLVGFN